MENTLNLIDAFSKFLATLDPGLGAECLSNTPARAVKGLLDLLSGYTENPADYVKLFDSDSSNLVVAQDLHFVSVCKHHLLPFFGRALIGYTPKDKILGLSKFQRILHCFSKRLQTQEDLSEQVCAFLFDSCQPEGCAVMLVAQHTCMTCRGANSIGSTTITKSVRGSFDGSDLELMVKLL